MAVSAEEVLGKDHAGESLQCEMFFSSNAVTARRSTKTVLKRANIQVIQRAQQSWTRVSRSGEYSRQPPLPSLSFHKTSQLTDLRWSLFIRSQVWQLLQVTQVPGQAGHVSPEMWDSLFVISCFSTNTSVIAFATTRGRSTWRDIIDCNYPHPKSFFVLDRMLSSIFNHQH